MLYVHLTLVPFISTAGELKTKPTQHSVKELTGLGIQPDILLCRTDRIARPEDEGEDRASSATSRRTRSSPRRDVECIYEVPLVFHDEGLDERIVEKLNIWTGTPNLVALAEASSQTVKNPKERVRIAMVGKYVDLTDSYKSLNEALAHGGIANECRVELDHVDSEKIEQDGHRRDDRARRRRHPRADGLRAARHRGQDRGRALRARAARCRSSASASACRWR